MENWTRAKQFALKAMVIDSLNAEAYSVLGSVAAHYEWDWEVAKRHFQKSVELAPNDAMIMNMLGDFYRDINHPQLIEIETKAIELDPLQFVNHVDLAVAYASRRDWPHVITFANNALKMNSLRDYQGVQGTATYFLVIAYLQLSKFEEAAKMAQDIPALKSIVDAYIAIESNKPKEGLRLTELIDAKDRFGSIWFYLKLGLWKEALVRMEEAYVQHNPELIRVLVFEEFLDRPELSSIMTKPEIKALLEMRKTNGALRQ